MGVGEGRSVGIRVGDGNTTGSGALVGRAVGSLDGDVVNAGTSPGFVGCGDIGVVAGARVGGSVKLPTTSFIN